MEKSDGGVDGVGAHNDNRSTHDPSGIDGE
jgi:hypothetical protein